MPMTRKRTYAQPTTQTRADPDVRRQPDPTRRDLTNGWRRTCRRTVRPHPVNRAVRAEAVIGSKTCRSDPVSALAVIRARKPRRCPRAVPLGEMAGLVSTKSFGWLARSETLRATHAHTEGLRSACPHCAAGGCAAGARFKGPKSEGWGTFDLGGVAAQRVDRGYRARWGATCRRMDRP